MNRLEAPSEWTSARLLDGSVVKRLSRRRAIYWLAAVLREWITIAAIMAIAAAWENVLVWIAAVFVIGSRQHALAVLVHDGAHFLVARSRAWNDGLSNYLAAYPLFFAVQGYRTHHLEHHRRLETPGDPEQITVNAYPREFTFPMSRGRLYWLMFRDLIGGSIKPMSTLIDYVWAVPGPRRPHVARILALHAFVAAAALVAGHIVVYLVLWVVPAFTSFTLFFRLRTAAEHSGIGRAEERYTRSSVDPLATTRTFLSGPIVGYLMSPCNISYHTEHHLYPSVPWFRLPALRRELLATREYAQRSHVTRGFSALMSELTIARH